jgi:hypothetical protein
VTREIQDAQFQRVLGALQTIDRKTFEQATDQQVSVNSEAWKKHLFTVDVQHLDIRPDEMVELVSVAAHAHHGHVTITRSDIVEIAAQATTKRDHEALLIAALAWGKGSGNNRMFPAFVRILSDEHLHTALSGSAQHAGAGRPADAYRAWRSSRAKGLGEAFFTKWLWAASHIGGKSFTIDAPRSLVLDLRVWTTLGDPSHRWNSIVAAGTRLRAERYAAYVRDCHRWADELGVEAEQVEWALFVANGAIVGSGLTRPK